MDNVTLKRVEEQAKEAGKPFEDFLGQLSSERRIEFCASFHLRPTSNGITIVSTLPVAPMRGVDVKSKDLSGKINDLNDALPKIKSADRNEAEKILKDFGFDKRKNEKNEPLEEDAQAAFVRDVIVNKFDGFTFIATEFVLFGFGGKNGGEKRPDVFVLREGILYDVELKNKRKGPSEKAGMGYSAITQAQEYVAHMKEPDNYDKYIRCLAAFPNGTSGEIKDIRGVALVPATASGGSSGTLEAAAKAAGVELWTFDKDKDYKIEKIICA